MKHRRVVFWWLLLMPMIGLVFVSTRAYSSEPTPPPTQIGAGTQEELAKQELQYYEKQNQTGNSESLNWTGIISVAGALIAAVVALLSLYVNNRTAIRNQRDAQFYEALKRFGDKDSASVRASAAGTIALLGQEVVNRWKRQTGHRLPRRRKVFLYYETAVNQLITGLMLEENSVTLTAIVDAAQKLVPTDPQLVLGSVHKANLALQKALVEILAEFFAAIGFTENWMYLSKINQAAIVSGYEEEIISQLIFRHSKQFDSSFGSAVQAVDLANTAPSLQANPPNEGEANNKELSLPVQSKDDPQVGLPGLIRRLLISWIASPAEKQLQASLKETAAKDKVNEFREIRRRLAVAGDRLHANVEVYSAVLRADPFRAIHLELGEDLHKWDANKLAKLEMKNVFLAEAELSETKLDGVDLEGAQLQLADLRMAELRKAKLVAARLEGASLILAKLEQADMSAARMGPFDFRDVNGKVRFSKETSLTLARLQQARVEHASLQGSDMSDADLQGVSFKNSSMLGVNLFHAHFDDQTNLEGADWWTANFLNERRALLYIAPLNSWYEKYQDKVPESLDKIHPSIRQYIENRRNSQQKQSEEQSN